VLLQIPFRPQPATRLATLTRTKPPNWGISPRPPCLRFPAKRRRLALNWVCFFAAKNRNNPHNTLSYIYLHSFWSFINWVCFFKLGSIYRRFLLFFHLFFAFLVQFLLHFSTRHQWCGLKFIVDAQCSKFTIPNTQYAIRYTIYVFVKHYTNNYAKGRANSRKISVTRYSMLARIPHFVSSFRT